MIIDRKKEAFYLLLHHSLPYRTVPYRPKCQESEIPQKRNPNPYSLGPVPFDPHPCLTSSYRYAT